MKLPSEFVEVYDFYFVPFWKTSWFFWCMSSVAVVTALLLCWLGYRAYCAHRARKNMRSPAQRALAELAAIKPNKALLNNEMRAFYFALSAILKHYLAEQYALEILSLTDVELRALFETHEVLSQHSTLVSTMLVRTQQVKFAPESVSAYVAADWESVHVLVAQGLSQQEATK